jgi:hypothetical protein
MKMEDREEMKRKANKMTEEILNVECKRIMKVMKIMMDDIPHEIVYIRMSLVEKMSAAIRDTAKKEFNERTLELLDAICNSAKVATTKEEVEALKEQGGKMISEQTDKETREQTFAG